LGGCRKEDSSNVKDIIFNPDIEYGSVTDIDGNTYKTLVIGNQEWMAENLRVTHYSNGDIIGTTSSSLDISGENSPKYQWAYNCNEKYAAIYGRLYTWYVVSDSRNLCPVGWHVSTNSDWITLTGYPTFDWQAIGGSLKELGNSHWKSPNTNATNSSGFSALPGGNRENIFLNLNEYGFWWTSTENSPEHGKGYRLQYNIGNIYDTGNYKWVGNSVRCVKN